MSDLTTRSDTRLMSDLSQLKLDYLTYPLAYPRLYYIEVAAQEICAELDRRHPEDRYGPDHNI